MNTFNLLRKLIFISWLLSIITLIEFIPAFAGSKDLIATNVRRISHENYRANPQSFGFEKKVWNSDNTRIMIWVSPLGVGYQLYWANVSDLAGIDYDSGRSESDFLTRWHRLSYIDILGPSNARTKPQSVWWSPFADEPNILYYSARNGKLIKYNVDSDTATEVTTALGFTNAAACFGWTNEATPRLVCHQAEPTNSSQWTSLGVGYYINVKGSLGSNTETITSPPNYCGDNKSNIFPLWMSHGHSTKSRDSIYSLQNYGFPLYVSSRGDEQDRAVRTSDCTIYADLTYEKQSNAEYPAYGVHVSWNGDNDWFLANSGGASLTSYPIIKDYYIWQVYFDRITGNFTYHRLLTQSTAHKWDDGVDSNNCYGGHFILTDRNDGKQMIWTSTNGHYCKEDYDKKGAAYSDWQYEGYYLADLTTASSSQTCTSFTYSNWGACQSNNTQTRTVTSSSPSGCTGGTPVLTQSCTYSSGTPAFTILKTTSTPTIDGNLTEYNNANSITFSPDSGGNTVTVKSLWTSEALYLGVNVTDTQLNASATTRDGSLWSDDSVEWFIDTYYDGGGSSNPDSAYMKADDYQGIVSIINTKYDSQGTTSGTPTSAWNGTWQSAVKLSGTANTNTDTDTEYSIEIKIPWTSIGYSTAPSSDTLVGMSFAVNDKDSGGTYSKMWLSSAGSNQNASNWQKVSLSGTLATADVVPPAPPGALMIR